MSESSLPSEIVESIAISNAKSIGEQPAILANMALANQILNNNLQQQMLIANQQAMSQVVMATMAKCVALITGEPANKDKGDANCAKALMELMQTMTSHGATGPTGTQPHPASAVTTEGEHTEPPAPASGPTLDDEG
jgi:hypothetical protein